MNFTEEEIAKLFDRWNESLQTGDPAKVVDNYAQRSILLPTVSNKLRVTREEKQEYSVHFLANSPSGKTDMRLNDISEYVALDSGLYSFTFAKTSEILS